MQSAACMKFMRKRHFLCDHQHAILPTQESREDIMTRAIVGCGVVICCGVLLMPWLVDAGAPLAAQEERGAHRLAVAEVASGPLAGLGRSNFKP